MVCVVPVRNDNKWKEGIGSIISIVVRIVVGVPGITVRTVVIGPIAVRIGAVKRPDRPDLQIVALNHRIGILRLVHSPSNGSLAFANDRNPRPRRQDGGIKKVLCVVRKIRLRMKAGASS